MAITISRLPPVRRFKEQLLKLDATDVSKDSLTEFLKNFPPDDERAQLVEESKAYPDARWEKSEEYIIHLVSIPMVEHRLKIWKYILDFPEDQEFILAFGKDLDEAFDILIASKTMRVILGITLALGNIMNGGNPRGQADGFNIEALARLNNIADIEKKTALQFIAEKLKKMCPDVDIGGEFAAVLKAQRMNIMDLEKKVKQISDGLRDTKNRRDAVARSIKVWMCY